MKKKSPKKSAAARPPIPREVYDAYLEHLKLRGMRMTSLEAKLGQWPSEEEKLAFTIDFDAESDMREEAVVFDVRFTIHIRDQSGAEVATITSAYAVICDAPQEPPEGFVEIFAPMNLSRLVYPFFREVVAGVTAKMELPTLFVPLNIFSRPRPAANPRKVPEAR
ncbi:MAG TPA: protein-export chaperone SecB [Fimbriimonadaceae bacterium]|nr:protein-export chaperone SecB [Fimbriimonadaceae bacterium]HRJ97906.1 protein-export chaperone SecB [Fimbriimonadaceae bacterium]